MFDDVRCLLIWVWSIHLPSTLPCFSARRQQNSFKFSERHQGKNYYRYVSTSSCSASAIFSTKPICFVEWCGPIWELTISEKNSLQRRSLAIKDDIFFTFFDLIIPINWCHESLPQFEMQDVAHQSGNLQPGQKLATALLFLSRLVSQRHLFHHLRSNHTNELM